ncbi:hypothetical protein N9D37_00965 [Erythrobacter sp.]|nr:hypothetical protein [Erythrobacter sp.]
MSGLGDVLSGSSLIVAILVAFYTIWQPGIAVAKNANVPNDKANRGPAQALVSAAGWKVGPLFVIALVTCSLLGKRSFTIVANAIDCATGQAVSAQCEYDDAAALFLIIEISLIVLTAVLAADAWAINAKGKEVKGK